jgi:hypothetical protein
VNIDSAPLGALEEQRSEGHAVDGGRASFSIENEFWVPGRLFVRLRSFRIFATRSFAWNRLGTLDTEADERGQTLNLRARKKGEERINT